MYLGKRIKELRIKKGLTQLELANLLYVNDRTISKWEQERGNPDVNIIPSLIRLPRYITITSRNLIIVKV